MVVATLHLGRSGYGRWGGRVTSVISYLASRQCWSSLCRTRSSAPRSWVVNDVRRPQDRIGRSWHRAGDGRDARIVGYRAAVEGPFEIRLSYAECGCFEGLLVAGLPDNTHRLATETSRCGT